MKETLVKLGEKTYRTYFLDTVVVGTGAAGYNAALRLWEMGRTNIAILTEGVNMGTSRNTGSDKQTYYKMNLSGDSPDSPHAMAEDFFRGKCVDGDNAYAEAALSVPSFLHLASLGVPFPVNRFGEYVGYKTDHDPRTRATSAGPLTSKLMTECLEKDAKAKGIPVLDGYLVLRVVKKEETAVGLLCLEKRSGELVLIAAANTVYCTGGPAGLYLDTVYPLGHHGGSGVALEAGVVGKNLTEWQFGLASTSPRWNVSGTYMQVLPRFVSVDAEGKEYEFLEEYFGDFGTLLSMVFQKGYEWPFDCRKVMTGSSVIDLLVYRETKQRGRRVYLDFRKNPRGLSELPYESLTDEARTYLEKAGATFGTPLERLAHMNQPAIDLYMGKGVDLSKEMLEIALCAQHNNGGLDVDLWWQTNIEGFFAAGEVAGSHGVYRPGGSALNAGQAGSMRAAQYIAARRPDAPVDEKTFAAAAAPHVAEFEARNAALRGREENASQYLAECEGLMSRVGGAIRDASAMEAAVEELRRLYLEFDEKVGAGQGSLTCAYRLRDALIGQISYLSAMADYAHRGGRSRGSSLYTDREGEAPSGFDATFLFRVDDGRLDGEVQNVVFDRGEVRVTWRPVRPLPEGGGFFENVWRRYREDGNVY